jgi:acyl-CoA synthetase (AMP-forming)/AMP-acid ligase II
VTWPWLAPERLREERHFDGRVLPCYVDRPRSLYALFAASLALGPDRECIVGDGMRLTWREADRLAGEAAAALAQAGIRPGDRVALLLPNRPEFLVLVLACARLGAIAVPLGTRNRPAELQPMLEDCGAAALVHDAELAANVPDRGRLPALRRIWSLGAALTTEPGDLFAAGGSVEPAAVAEEDTAVILYTSGTTGRPKGAMLTHLGIVHSAINFATCVGLRPEDRAVLTVPASHVTGLVGVVATMLRAGGCTVLMRAFKARDFLAVAADERLSYTILVPAQYGLCLLEPELDRFDLSSWRIGCFGGAPMPEATIAALAEHLPGLTLVNGYGATETTSPSSITPPGHIAGHADSIGQAVPGCTVRIVGEDGRDVPPGAPGELWIKGPHVVPGYWNRPDANAAEFTAGFWHSGDIGSIDEAGWLRVFDRKKDMINRAGFKVYSAEVENVLSHHPAVIESAVVGVPDAILGERVRAVVHARAAVTPAELRAFCADRLADYKVPEIVDLSPEPLPRNANGKLQKAKLRG